MQETNCHRPHHLWGFQKVCSLHMKIYSDFDLGLEYAKGSILGATLCPHLILAGYYTWGPE